MAMSGINVSSALSNGAKVRYDNVYIKGEKYEPPFANEPKTYKELREKQRLERSELLSNPKRFQRISEREDRTDVPLQTRINISLRNHLATYRGFYIWKCPIDYVLSQLGQNVITTLYFGHILVRSDLTLIQPKCDVIFWSYLG